MKRGCGKEIDFVTAQNIVLHTEICGEKSKWVDDLGMIVLCNKCRKDENGVTK